MSEMKVKCMELFMQAYLNSKTDFEFNQKLFELFLELFGEDTITIPVRDLYREERIRENRNIG